MTARSRGLAVWRAVAEEGKRGAPGVEGFLYEDRPVLFLRRDDAEFARELQRVLEHVVRHDVELLLLLALHVD